MTKDEYQVALAELVDQRLDDLAGYDWDTDEIVNGVIMSRGEIRSGIEEGYECRLNQLTEQYLASCWEESDDGE